MTEAVDFVPDHEQRFAAWVRPHVPAMARLASRLAAGADRDDIVQEALARAWVNGNSPTVQLQAPLVGPRTASGHSANAA